MQGWHLGSSAGACGREGKVMHVCVLNAAATCKGLRGWERSGPYEADNGHWGSCERWRGSGGEWRAGAGAFDRARRVPREGEGKDRGNFLPSQHLEVEVLEMEGLGILDAVCAGFCLQQQVQSWSAALVEAAVCQTELLQAVTPAGRTASSTLVCVCVCLSLSLTHTHTSSRNSG